jgi:hypothetical protein
VHSPFLSLSLQQHQQQLKAEQLLQSAAKQQPEGKQYACNGFGKGVTSLIVATLVKKGLSACWIDFLIVIAQPDQQLSTSSYLCVLQPVH